MQTRYYGIVGKNDYFKFENKRLPLHQLLDKYLQPDGWLVALSHNHAEIPREQCLILESGAWAYREQKIPKIKGNLVTTEYALAQYRNLSPSSGDILASPDHLLIPGTNIKERIEFNQAQSLQFLPLVQKQFPQCIPLAVIHGETLKDKIQRALELYDQGYRLLGIGGLVPLANNKALTVQIVKEIRANLPQDCKLHVLGLSSPSYYYYWNQIGIDSCDGSAYLQDAFRGTGFYEAIGSKIITYDLRSTPVSKLPWCNCAVCRRLHQEGYNSQSLDGRINTLGRAAHNLGATISAQFAARIPRRIALIACVKQKQPSSAPAKELYISDWWQAAKQYAEASNLEYYALSALHGVVHPNRVLQPYDHRLPRHSNQHRREWSRQVVKQLAELAPNGSTFIFISGKSYHEDVIPLLRTQPNGKDYLPLTPLAGLGIGQQKQWLRFMLPKHLQLSIF